MGQTREQKIVKQLSGIPTNQQFTPIATEMFLPNHSGIAVHPEIQPLIPPTGSMIIFCGITIPNGWLLCDGSEISRTTYSELFEIAEEVWDYMGVGVFFGTGNGTTTFNLPNSEGIFYRGTGDSAFFGGSGGEATHILTTAEMPAHTHNYDRPRSENINNGSGSLQAVASDTSFATTATSSTGRGTAHNNLPPYVNVNFIIKT